MDEFNSSQTKFQRKFAYPISDTAQRVRFVDSREWEISRFYINSQIRRSSLRFQERNEIRSRSIILTELKT